MKRKASWTQFIPFVLVAGVFLSFPFLVGLEDFAPGNLLAKLFYFVFLLGIIAFCFFEMIRLGMGEGRENRLLSGKVTSTRTTGTFLESKVKSRTEVNGRIIRSYHHIRFSYKDEYGVYRTYQTHKIYNSKEVHYLRTKCNFDILAHGGVAVIVEDLNEYKMQDFYSKRRAEGIYDNIEDVHNERDNYFGNNGHFHDDGTSF